MLTKSRSDKLQSAQIIYAELRKEILNGVHEPGTRLGENMLAERFKVSRGPVREALNLLSESRIITLVPNSGARVRQITRADAASLYQVRAALESEAASLAAAANIEKSSRSLRNLLDDHAGTLAAHPDGAYLQNNVDGDFHVAIARMAGNPILLQYLTRELYPQLILLRQHHKHIRGRGLTALKEHERIAAAIADGDAEIAALLMRRHINNSWASLEPQLTDNGGEQ